MTSAARFELIANWLICQSWFLTARAQTVDREAALKSGADGYLTKPVNSQELIERLDDLLNHDKSSDSQSEALVVSFMSLRGGCRPNNISGEFG